MQGQLILDPNSCRLTLSGSLSESGGGEGCRARSGARSPVTRELQVARGVGLKARLVVRRGPCGTTFAQRYRQCLWGWGSETSQRCHHNGLMAFLVEKGVMRQPRQPSRGGVGGGVATPNSRQLGCHAGPLSTWLTWLRSKAQSDGLAGECLSCRPRRLIISCWMQASQCC